jgi:LysM repeat protein
MPPMKSPRLFRTCSSRTFAAGCLLALSGFAASPLLNAQSLQGSRVSLLRQTEMARQHDYTYLRTSDQVHEFARRGLLVRLTGSSSYRLAAVSFPYARPEVKTFIERLGSQYRAACGERLVVTSLTRPISRQPSNASHLSVHPTGMAVDLRLSNRSSCRRWIEKTLLTLERRGVAEATRERHPPHYHVTLFPKPYMRYLAGKGVREQTVLASSETRSYRVGRGDSLWEIARRHGTSVTSIKKANGIRSSRLQPGQVLEIPITR